MQLPIDKDQIESESILESHKTQIKPALTYHQTLFLHQIIDLIKARR